MRERAVRARREPLGARNTAFKVFTNHESRNTNHGLFIVCFDRRVVRNAGYCLARGASQREFRGFHETRITAFFRPGCATGGATGNRRPDHCPRRQAAVFQFAIVHDCSRLFTIVHYCSPLFSKNILPCASVLAPPGRCFPARCGAARAAMARHGRPPSPAPATRPVRFSRITRH